MESPLGFSPNIQFVYSLAESKAEAIKDKLSPDEIVRVIVSDVFRKSYWAPNPHPLAKHQRDIVSVKLDGWNAFLDAFDCVIVAILEP